MVIVPVLVSSIYFINRDNFHPLIPGEVYRSAQLSADSLEQYVQENNLRAVLNLRGASPEDDWYQAEKAVSSRLGIDQIDIRLQAYRLPGTNQVKELLKILNQITKPYLIHCEGGADRTGLVSAIILLNEGKQSMSEIEKQVSWRYFALKDNSAGKLFFNEYQVWLKANMLEHSPLGFSDWLQNVYQDGNGNLGFVIDRVNGMLPTHDQQGVMVFNVPRSTNALLKINGWALDHDSESLIAKIEVLIDQKTALLESYGNPRPDVGSHFRNPKYNNSGWNSEFDQDSLVDGCHQMQLRITRLDGTVWQSSTRANLCINGQAGS